MNTRLEVLELRADSDVADAMLKCASVADIVSELFDAEGSSNPSLDVKAEDNPITQARTYARTQARALGETLGQAGIQADRSILPKIMLTAPVLLGAAAGNKPLTGAVRGLGTGTGMVLGYKGGRKLGEIVGNTQFMQKTNPNLRALTELLAVVGGTALGGGIGYKVTKALT
jgi:hypothetical protein